VDGHSDPRRHRLAGASFSARPWPADGRWATGPFPGRMGSAVNRPGPSHQAGQPTSNAQPPVPEPEARCHRPRMAAIKKKPFKEDSAKNTATKNGFQRRPDRAAQLRRVRSAKPTRRFSRHLARHVGARFPAEDTPVDFPKDIP